MLSIYDFKSYKTYLSEYGASERGLLTKLAEAAECQKSYLSACLNSKNNLTLDHALGIAELLKLDDNEQEFLFLLIEKERASTPKLRRKLEDKLKKLSREAYRLKNQQKDTIIIGSEGQSLGSYYATWLATAIHTLTSIPDFQTVPSIALRLGLSKDLTSSVVAQLESLDLVKKAGQSYRWNSGNIHLADTGAWIANHHMNWRLRAVDDVQKRTSESTHYTAIQSMSEDDFELLKKRIAQFIKEFNTVSDPSDPEDAFCFNIDFYKI